MQNAENKYNEKKQITWISQYCPQMKLNGKKKVWQPNHCHKLGCKCKISIMLSSDRTKEGGNYTYDTYE